MRLGLLLLLVGCARVVEAPATWRAEGCDAAAPEPDAAGVALRTQARWLLREDGLRLRMGARYPAHAGCTGAVVLVPPGLEPGLGMLDGEPAARLAEAGLRVYGFDPRGRGESEGEEDVNGALGQDDLAALLRYVSAEEDVDPRAVVLFSRSLGGALAAGALGRHADLAVRGWVDFESPGWLQEDLDHAVEFTRDQMYGFADASDDPEAWWAEREPAGFMGGVIVPYHRLQGVPDHALNWLGNAVAMVNEATAAPSVRYNDVEVGDVFTVEEAAGEAVQGGLDPKSDTVTDAILAAFAP